jgi:hypothetical protein
VKERKVADEWEDDDVQGQPLSEFFHETNCHLIILSAGSIRLYLVVLVIQCPIVKHYTFGKHLAICYLDTLLRSDSDCTEFCLDPNLKEGFHLGY